MEKSSLASILQRKKNKNLTLAHRQLWGMIDLVYKDFYDKESKIYDAGNVTREEFSIIKHVYKTRHVVNYTEIKAVLDNQHLSHVGWVIKNLEKKDDWTIGIYNDLYDRMLYYLAMKMLRNRMNHASNSLTDDDRAGIEYLASKGIHFMKEGTDINAEDAQFELDIDTIKEIIREGIAPELKENKKIK